MDRVHSPSAHTQPGSAESGSRHAPNYRFQEYTTSGAFSLSLTRNQVSALIHIASGLTAYHGGSHTAALERKGLVEHIAAPEDYAPDRHEYRATAAGLLVAAMLVEAGLSTASRGAMAEEVARLQAALEDARLDAHTARTQARSALAKLERAELDLTNERELRRHDRLSVRILRRDPMPETTAAELRDALPPHHPANKDKD